MVSAVVNFLYLIVTVLVEYCEGPGSGTGLCHSVMTSVHAAKLYQSNALILSLYAVILDFIFGSILFLSMFSVPSVKKAINAIRGTRHAERYTRRAKTLFSIWATLLIILFILVFVENFVPGVYRTTHIALILNNLNQLINTLQFYAAFQLLIAVDFLMKLGSGKKKINSFVIEDGSGSDPASDAHASSPSMRELFQVENSLSRSDR
jgi:hypothetical protein